MKVLVTGGNGFIGQYVVDRLAAMGHMPIVFDRRYDVSNPRETFLGDTRDLGAVMEAVSLSDAVIHLAGVLGTQETIKEPIPAVETNIIGGLNVFKAIAHYDVPATYIAVGNYWMNNSYSISKTTAERFAFMANKEWGTHIAVVRALNAYGPRQKAYPVRKIMPNLIIPALEGKNIQVYGDGTQIMDMIWADDVAEILIRAALIDHGVYDSVFEAGTGRETSVLGIARTVLDQVGRDPDDIDFLPMRPGEPDHSIVIGDPTTLEPLDMTVHDLMPLEVGVGRTVQWYEEHR